ncbi:MAG: ABC transporter ATP-binding protein [Thermoprotei archaeon]|nr:MAG: ABC transporter ATP-binding protein [Thermoprotei archaeon]
MVDVKLRNIVKKFGKYVALNKVSLDIRDGELFFILGPSGCGKTTMLRIIAGLYEPDEGDIYFGENRVNDVPPYARNIGMVFQNYALWPHMTVYDNIAYGLKARGLSSREIDQKVKWALKLVRMEGMEKKYPNQLSGGQQQRVALARALVIEPDVLLLDEPLSNLDAKLRARMRSELKFIQKDLGLTAIYVTHDQAEALSMADRIAVMNIGVVEQVGTPLEIYEKPRTKFVADFIGEINMLEGVVVGRENGLFVVETVLGKLKVAGEDLADGQKVTVSFRPENVKIRRGKGLVKVRDVMFYGFYEELVLEVGEVQLKAFLPGREVDVKPGEVVSLEIDPSNIVVFREK